MKFIYINEDGRVGVSDTPPTETDLACIGDGLLQVLIVAVDCDDPPQDGGDIWPTILEVDENGVGYPPCDAVLDEGPEGDNFHVIE